MRSLLKTFLAKSVANWRDWLAQQHESESEVWLVFHKKHSGVASIARGNEDKALEGGDSPSYGWQGTRVYEANVSYIQASGISSVEAKVVYAIAQKEAIWSC